MSTTANDLGLANNDPAEQLVDPNAGVPDYLKAADFHNQGNGQGSWFDPVSAIEHGSEFAAATAIRAATSAYNVIPAVTHLAHKYLGTGELDYAKTGDVISHLDNNLSEYYQAHKGPIDIVGDIVGSLVPGTAGIKVLNYGQKALKLLPEGKGVFNLARSIGALPQAADKYAEVAAKEIGNNMFSTINKNAIKSFASGYGQAFLEGAAYQVAAGVTMGETSPLFENQTASDIVLNSLYGGGLIGAGVFGSALTAQTYFKIKRAANVFDKASRPFTHIMEPVPGTPAYARLATRVVDLNHLNDLEAQGKVGDFVQQAARKRQRLQVLIRDELNGIIGAGKNGKPNPAADPELGDLAAPIFANMNNSDIMSNTPNLVEIGRGVKKLNAEKDIEIAQQIGNPTQSSIMFTRLWGDGAGNVTLTPPKVLNLADTMKDNKEVAAFVKKQRFKKPGEEQDWSVLNPKINNKLVEARFIHVRKFISPKDFADKAFNEFDFPMLDRAYNLGVEKLTLRHSDGSSTAINSSAELLNHITSAKQYVAHLAFNADNSLSTDSIAQLLGVRTSWLEGVHNQNDPLGDVFVNRNIPSHQLLLPQNMKMGFRPAEVDKFQPANTNNVTAYTWLKQIQNIQQTGFNNVFANFTDSYHDNKQVLFPEADDAMIWKTTRNDGGAGFATAASGNYGTAESFAQSVGHGTHQLNISSNDRLSASLVPDLETVKNHPQAAQEMLDLHQMIRQSDSLDPYMLVPPDINGPNPNISDMLIKRSVLNKVSRPDGSLDTSKLASILQDDPASVYEFKNDETKNLVNAMVNYNDTHLTQYYNMWAAQGLQFKDLRGVFHLPGPDPKKFPYFSFVVDNSVTGTGHVSMLHARSAEELAQLESQVPVGNGLQIVRKQDTEQFFKARQMYNYDLGLNENYINSALRRRGIAPYFPKYDINEFADEYMSWRRKTAYNLNRDMVSMKYASYFGELHRLGENITAAATSKYSPLSLRMFAENAVKNPYADITKTALDITKESDYPLWTAFNQFAGHAFTGLRNVLQTILTNPNKSGNDKLDEMNKTLEDAGMGNPFKTASLSLIENHPAGRGPLDRFISRSNSLFSFLMLQSDPLNAVNNGIGHTVLLGSETRDLVNAIKNGNQEVAGKLAQLAEIQVPGMNKSMLAPAKLIANAYGTFFKYLRNDPEATKLMDTFKQMRWVTDVETKIKEMMDNLVLEHTSTPSQLEEKITKARQIAEKWSGNTVAEQMNRFVSAHVAHQLASLGVESGVLPAREAISYINTFVNRTNGVYLTSQRPLMFTGAIGKAIGLFQTYQFNIMHHMFRHLGSGDKKAIATLMGLQGTVYGMNGLPAFNAINHYIVGNAYGNTNHSDIISTTFDAAGHNSAEWLLYGLSSNMFLDPRLKINLYTRGDINPRQITIVPVMPQDVPIVGAMTNLTSSVINTAKKIYNGADVSEAILQGVEHAQISRPLAGMAEVAMGHSTTMSGDIVMQNDLYSLTTLARLVGARPLDEAVARDAMYRVKSYEASSYAQIRDLGSAIRNKVTGGGIEGVTQNDVENFLERYVHAGGDQKNFQKFWAHELMTATHTTAQQMSQHSSSQYSQYLQKILAGSLVNPNVAALSGQ